MPGRPQASDDLLDELVHQFTDPFAFFRELIQNSIDAGSTRVEVTLRFRPGAERGLMTAAVADWGEGMDRRIIEDYLLTKFRSTKENDLTKIGKFGIGFLSVFACAPDLVVVDTGRDAEFWRVLFKSDRSYELLRSEEPIDGTRITLHREMTAAEYDEFVARSFGAVTRWCRHSEADVAFAAGGADGGEAPEPKPVREPLQVDAPYQVEHREEGTIIIAGPSRQDPPITGLYNRGLTLLETTEGIVPGVALKIVSRYLEHTLTRDNVRRDKHFGRAIELAQKLADGPMKKRLPDEMRAAAERPDGAADFEVLRRFAHGRVDLEAMWFRQPGGGAVSGKELKGFARELDALVVSPEPDPLVSRMRSSGLPVLEGEPGGGGVEPLRVLLGVPRAVLAREAFAFAEAVAEDLAGRAFCSAATPLLEAAGARAGELAIAVVHGAGADRPSIAVEALGRPIRAEQALRSPFARGAPRILCLNRQHPLISPVIALSAHSPRLAALLAVRLLAVSFEALDEAADRRLTALALSA